MRNNLSALLRPLLCGVFLAAAAGPAPAQAPQTDRQTLRDARADLRRGNYDPALKALRRLAQSEPDRWSFRDLLIRACLESGRPEEARKACEEFLRTGPDHPRALGRLAHLQLLEGDPAAAVETSSRAPASLEATVTRAEALLALGRRAEAAKLLEPIPGQYEQSGGEYMKADLFQTARGMALYSDLAGKPDLYKRVVHTILPDCLVPDPEDPPVKTFLARCYLDKHDLAKAETRFGEALGVNSNFVPALAGLARVKLEQGRLADARKLCELALKADAAAAEAHYVLALAAALERNLSEAIRRAQEGLQARPKSLELRSLLAAAAGLKGDADLQKKELEAVLKIRPDCPLPHWETGRLLVRGGHRRLLEAHAHLRKAAETDPGFLPAQVEYGLNCLRLGEEETAAEILRAANKRDPFDARVQDAVNLLDEFREKYEIIETDACRIRLAGSERAWMEPRVRSLLERAREELDKRYGAQPGNKLLVEILPDTSAFSIRLTGVPHPGWFVDCTGPVVVALSPRVTRRIGRPFHWGAAVWRGLCHARALELSGGRVPRWFLEGLSAYEQSLAFGPVLRDGEFHLMHAIHTGELRGVAGLDSAEERDAPPVRLQLQGAAVARYIAEEYGPKYVVQILKNYRSGAPTEDVFQDALGRDVAAFDEAFRKWLDLKLGRNRFIFPPEESSAKLLEEAGKGAKEATLAARRLLSENKIKEAIGQARAALKADPDHAQALSILGRCLRRQHNRDEGLEALREAVAKGADDYQTLYAAGRAFLEEDRVDKAIPLLEEAKKAFPPLSTHPGAGRSVRHLLNDAYLRQKKYAEAVRQMEEIAAVDLLDFETRIKLSRLYGDDERWDASLKILEEAAWIQPRDRELQMRTAQALAARGRADDAAAAYGVCLALIGAGETQNEREDLFEVHCRLAELYLSVKKRAEARGHAREALKLVPGSARAQRLFSASEEE